MNSSNLIKIFRYALLSKLVFVCCLLKGFSLEAQKAPAYLDGETPGLTPELFAEGKVNTDAIELNAVFNASMTEFFFTRIIDGNFIIHHSELKDGFWTDPEPLEMFPKGQKKSIAVDMTITQDGNTMYFLGMYSPDSEEGNGSWDIWTSQKKDGNWGKPTLLPAPISDPDHTETYPVVVADGSLYFVSNRPGGVGKRDIYRAQYLGDGKFDTPLSLGSEINTESGSGDTYVSPDESYLIYSTQRPEGTSGMHVSFKKDGQWSRPVYLGDEINTQWTDFCPYMSPDGKYFFFSRRYSDPPDSGWSGVVKGEIYWADSEIIFQKNPDR